MTCSVVLTLISTGLLMASSGSTANESLLLDRCSAENATIRLLTLLPYRDSRCPHHHPSFDYHGGLSILPALDLAVEQINSMSDFLPCHMLELLHKEIGCEVTAETTVGLTSGLFPIDRGRVVGIIGPVCSQDSVQVSSLTNRPGLKLVVLHNAGSPMLSDRTRFPNSLGILGTTHSLVDLSLALMKESRWQNIALLYEDTHLFYRSIKEQFIALVRDHVNILYLSGIMSNFYPLRDISISKARIIFILTSPKHSRRVMCLAYHQKLVYPRYQWVIVGQRLSDFMDKGTTINYQGKDFHCSPTVLTTVALEGAFLLSYQFSTDNVDSIEVLNSTFDEFLKLYGERVNTYNSRHPHINISPTYWAYSMYDAVWAWAIVLNQLMSTHTVLNLDYGETTFKTILNEFYSIDFEGMSGHINFNPNNGFVNRPANLFFIVDGKEKHVASNNGTTTISLQHFETVPDIVRVVSLPHKGIVGFFLAAECVMFAIVLVLQSLTFFYRDSKHIKASSPKLSHVAFLGEYSFILAIVLYTVLRAKEYSSLEGTIICRAVWMWLLPLSHTLTMGIVIVRTWRLYRIFTHYLNPGKFISNSGLLIILFVLVMIDVLFATVWMAVDPMQFELIEYRVESGPDNELVLDQSCRSRYTIVWLVLVFSYKIILLITMVILSILTRHIPNRTFATNSLRIFSYVFCTVFIIGFSLYYLFWFLDSNSNIADFIVLNILFIVFAAIFLMFVVFPPILPIFKYILNLMHTCIHV